MSTTEYGRQELSCSGLPLNKSCWLTNRPVGYSAALYSLYTRWYIGQAYCPIDQLATQQAAGVKLQLQARVASAPCSRPLANQQPL